jgi:hypothetical protein
MYVGKPSGVMLRRNNHDLALVVEHARLISHELPRCIKHNRYRSAMSIFKCLREE